MNKRKNLLYGIIGAMDKEIAEILKQAVIIRKYKKAKLVFYEAKLKNKFIIIVKCKVGKVNASICTQILIDKYNVDMIINTGVAGALDKRLDIFDIVVADDVIIHDMDVTSLGYKAGQNPDFDFVSFKSKKMIVNRAKKIYDKSNKENKLVCGRVLTGDQFISSEKVKKEKITKFGGLCIDMESGAIAQVCLLNNVPFLIIRSISDKANENVSYDYRKFVIKASKISADFVVALIDNSIGI